MTTPKTPKETPCLLKREFALAEVKWPGIDRQFILQRFLGTLGRNDDCAVSDTKALFYALRSVHDGASLALLKSGALAPRPAALWLAEMWKNGAMQPLDIGNPQRLIVPLFRRARDEAGDVLMAENRQWPAYQALPSSFTIYRGSRQRLADMNPSWCMDAAVARRFAQTGRGSDHGRVLSAAIDKLDALALFNMIGERELVVDPAGLRNVRVVEDRIQA